MGFFNKIFGKKNEEKRGGMEDYMTLIRVYFQAAIAETAGITNLAALPDLRMFKSTLKVPTVNNKLGIGEKRQCRKMQDVQIYLVQFQNFTQDLMMLTGNLMKFKLRLPSFMKKALYTVTEKNINDIFHKNDFSDPGVLKTAAAVRNYNRRLGFSEKWVTDFVYQVVMLAKKEPKPKDQS